MAFRLNLHQSLSEDVKRIVADEIESAVNELSQTANGKRDKAVHEARKSVKKIRGTLLLVRPELGAGFREENRRFRDIGRRLSDLRDAGAIIETFDELIEKHKHSPETGAFHQIRLGLERSKKKHEDEVHVDEMLQEVVASLKTAAEHIPKWHLKADGFALVAPGLEDTYRDGRKLMNTIEDDASPEVRHEWRKKVKAHWYHVRLLEDLWPDVMQAHQSTLSEIETALGDDHNLMVLREKLEAAPDEYGGEETVQVFTALATAEQQALSERAFALGQLVYDEKAATFRKYMERLWQVSRAQKSGAVDKKQKNIA